MSVIKKKPKLILLLTGISFIAGSIDCFENNLIIIGVISASVASINIVASFFVIKHPFKVKIALHLINAIYAAVASYIYFLAGRALQYGWAIVSILYFINIGVVYTKRLKNKNKNINPVKINEEVEKQKMNNKHSENPVKIEIGQTKVIAIFAAFILFYFASVVLWRQNIIDNEIVIHFNFVYANEVYLQLMKGLSHYGMSLITALYALFVFLTFKNEDLKNERSLLFLIVISFALAGIGGDLLKEIIDRARPGITLSGQVAIKQIHETPSFPSGHATKSMAFVLPFVMMASRKNNIINIVKILTFIIALLVCYSRVALQAHYLSDVLAGIGTAFFFLPIAVWFTNIFNKKRKITEDKLGSFSQRFIFIFIALTVVLCFI